jgi:hypothetical protein
VEHWRSETENYLRQIIARLFFCSMGGDAGH